MAAALATLAELERRRVVERLDALGQLLRAGLAERAAGLGLRQSGPPAMPLLLFDEDADFARGRTFCAAALRAGAYLHPRHNMFLCAAHDEADVATVLRAAEAGFAAVRRMG
jgi:glutamate-1-semialdehyde 2,1-aminomutase